MKSWNKSLQSNYGTPTLELVSGKGATVIDSKGDQYLDFLAGIATNVLGHAHPAVVKAVTKQISTLGHVSNLYAHPNVIALAEKLAKLTGDKSARVFFCNSGAEANEAALKVSRKTGRTRIVATKESFHGRTMGALSLTGQPEKSKAFKPLIKGVTHVPYGDMGAMLKKVNKKTAMVIVEPVMGEAGVIVPPHGYLQALRELCDDTGALLVFDCVQTGMGRTGDWFGYEYSGIKPDVITLAKGLGGGLPLGAMIALGDSAELFQPGDHGSTFGGNPVATAAALAVIETIESKKLLKRVGDIGTELMVDLALIEGVKSVRGAGLLIGIEFTNPIAKKVAAKCQKNGVLVNGNSETVIRIAPPLIITDRDVAKFLKVFTESVHEVAK
ncbi:MAG: acetylornithine transaminase [Candidatus Planktophila sp.]|nr:acetylornithine transaminase [Candidatus Planktophila sp.]MBP7902944.1 acetylornithine transaminase [Candidatus Planktophila sp.]